MRILLLNSLDICITNPYNMRNYLTNLKQGVAGVARTPKVEADDNSSDYPLFIIKRLINEKFY